MEFQSRFLDAFYDQTFLFVYGNEVLSEQSVSLSVHAVVKPSGVIPVGSTYWLEIAKFLLDSSVKEIGMIYCFIDTYRPFM